MPFSTVALSAWGEIHDHAHPGWLYRGQRVATWDLATSLERFCTREGITGAERARVEAELFREFRRVYHQYALHIPARSATLEWLSLMQHHGAPTRLLDFTYSIYVASYFALETTEGDCSVWAINGPWSLQQSLALFRGSTKGPAQVDKLSEPFTEGHEGIIEALFFETPYVPLACPLNPFRLNERLSIQKGAFLLPGAIDQGFMANLEALPGHGDPGNVLKITIPVALRRDALQRLLHMNISRTSLFPGLDGFSQSLGVYHPALAPVKWT